MCSRDQSRPVLTSLYLRIIGEGEDRRGFLEGTDSYKLGRVPVDVDETDTEGFVPVDVITTARKCRSEHVSANGTLDIAGGPSFPRPELGQFPNTEHVFPLEGRETSQAF